MQHRAGLAALKGLDPEGETFLDATARKPIMDLRNAVVESECVVAKQ